MRQSTWLRCSHGPVGRPLTRICNLDDRPHVRRRDGFVLRRTGGYSILANAKDGLASRLELLDMFAAIWGL